ncbi:MULTISPECIES: GntR family transcriptional regulator [unclassified Pseudofrankia]|uniref:GntR family transcriptional regulator n=1 Tax=unclassified Pseudofrankia TaxID=2994372 RepID=UPI000A5A53EF|nr:MULTISPECIES: GntR family transcriptional regulator [unclassified Pseudofrankia]MDT3442322.1 GntR family transcriptional regulator [Pseudofrankia sp. BMG5.37]
MLQFDQSGSLDPSSSLGPTAAGARRRLRQLVTDGTRGPGERLGGERDLAAALGVSRATLRQALTALEREGVILRVRGRGGGTFVAPRKVERDLSRIVGVPELLRAQGFTAGSQVVSAGLEPADVVVATALALAPGDPVARIVRIRLADGGPISLENACFPAYRFPGLFNRSLSGSLYELFADEYGVRPGEAVEQIEVVVAGDEEAALLRTPAGAALLALQRTTYDPAGEPFEYSHDLFRADRIRIVVRSAGATVATTR